MSLSNDKALKSVAEAVSKIMEAEKKAKMDYDKDGKVESPKDEVWGSRFRAAKMAGKMKEETEQLDEMDIPNSDKMSNDERHKAIMAKYPNAKKVGKTPGGYSTKGSGKPDLISGIGGVRKLKEDTERLDEKMVSIRHTSTGKELKVPVSSVQSYKAGGYTPVSPGSVKEESELDEAFPSVEDAKKRMDTNKSKFEKTKTSTGTVYKRKMEDEKKEVKESLSFTEMLELYNEHGLKVLAPIETEEIEVEGNTIEVIDADKINGYVETVVEEADEEEFNKDLDKNKAKAAGKAKQPDLAKGDVQAVKNEEVEQLDELSAKTLTSYVGKRRAQGANPSKAKPVNRAITKAMSKQTSTWQKEEVEELDERHLTSAETEKKEDYAKAMKKGLSGFRKRYGDRAKEVMYATATKMAKKD